MTMAIFRLRVSIFNLSVMALALIWVGPPLPAVAQVVQDDIRRIAVLSDSPSEISVLRSEIDNPVAYTVNGVEFSVGALQGKDIVLFLSGSGIVNTAMTVQLALDHFNIDRIVFSGIAGGVDPALNIGDVVIADRWGQYLEMLYAKEVEGGWETLDLFEYPFANYGMMFPRPVTVQKAGADAPETRFWFPVDEAMLESARLATTDLALERCTEDDICLRETPAIVIGGSGVSGSAFIDNAAFREYTFRTFGARLLDMESAALAHVAYANNRPFIAIRSLADLAGGGEGKNQIDIFFRLAAGNAVAVVRALLSSMPVRR